eukprot:TRINITY_DN3833_c0_g1_i1.p1 TRINITY_DN3833_c0_g1~~TRINITY_DN3833_c0_g1_i1.p1  ORF type:complete len:368 (+),score=121.89 TRINITY_DN3833_c0_g1_i1:150-1253(+)
MTLHEMAPSDDELARAIVRARETTTAAGVTTPANGSGRRRSRRTGSSFLPAGDRQRLLLNLRLVAAGVRAAALLEFYHHNVEPPLHRLLCALGLEHVGALTIAEGTAPFLVNKPLLLQRLVPEPQPAVLLDVSQNCRMPIDVTDTFWPRLQTLLRTSLGMGAGHDWLTNMTGSSTVSDISGIGCRSGSKTTTAASAAAASTDDAAAYLLQLALEPERVPPGLGLCALAGWLLEYPVLYCADSGAPNCLGMKPLLLHDIAYACADAGHAQAAAAAAAAADAAKLLPAFSFTVPLSTASPCVATAAAVAAAAVEQRCDVLEAGAQRAVDAFLQVLRDRTDECCSREGASASSYKPVVTLSVVTLPTVAL